jgi:hypothetical protein
VVRAAAVLEQPLGDARSVGTVAIGEILDVLDERNGWYLVRPPAGSPARDRNHVVYRGLFNYTFY